MTTLLTALGLVTAGALYGRGVARLAGRSRARLAAGAVGLASLAAAEIPAVGERAASLFWVHMVQHLALILVAAPLLAYGRISLTLYLGLPSSVRRRLHPLRRALRPLSRVFKDPRTAWALAATALWAWHVPGLYEAALRSTAVHALEHAAFLGTAFLLWSRVLDRSLHPLGRALLVFATAFPTGLLAAVLLFAPRPLYPTYLLGADGGLTPLQDQQLGGVLMWVPPAAVYFTAVAALVLSGLRSSGGRASPIRTATHA